MATPRGDVNYPYESFHDLLGEPDVSRLGELDVAALLRIQIAEQVRTNRLLIELVTTSRFNRGNYDGPFMGRRIVTIQPATRRLRIIQGKGYPICVVLRWPNSQGALLLTANRGDPLGGGLLDVSVEGEKRLIVDRRQDIYVSAQIGVAANIDLEIEEGRA